MTEMFGGDAAGWGDGEGVEPAAVQSSGEMDEQNPDERLPGRVDLGGGIALVINPEYFKMIMHTPEITAMVDARCEELTNECNSIAVREDAEYVYQVSNNPENIRARGRVKPGNMEARMDDAENSTLLKALATVGSDPLPPSYFTTAEDYTRHVEESLPQPAAEPPPEGTVGGSYMGGDNE